MTTQSNHKLRIEPRVGIFSSELVPLEEAVGFFSLATVQVPTDRPYIWTNTVTSLDGVISFWEEGEKTAVEISMSHVPNSGGKADWRMLQTGWTLADAVIISPKEEETSTTIYFNDLLEYRKNVLKMESPYPAQIIITGRGEFNFGQKRFHDTHIRKIIVTTHLGHINLLRHAKEYLQQPTISDDEAFSVLKEKLNIKVRVIETLGVNSVDIVKMCHYLRTEENIRYMECSAGGYTISQMLYLKLVDECRFTTSGQVCGHFNSLGEPRPTMFNENTTFGSQENPLLHYAGIRIYGLHHVFIRGVWEYRHNAKS
eukprot:TRINITY_DN1075_c0_g1_i1.p1 TRINITY_DN1075_c0_g1~~TRINITY_DN1075_c0_g1_i1.p1  ORF type:complete len:313 (-),score=41.25 TRINITY_DN1075_c0_g1_i1:25-963(-)